MISPPQPPPLLRKLFDTRLRDPSICPGPDGAYYLTGTSEPFWKYNNAHGIRVWKSRDLTTWEPLGTVWRYGESPWHAKYLQAQKPLWAPEIHYKQGAFWLTYSLPGWDGTAQTSGSGLLKSTTGKPEGPYEDMQPATRLGDEIDASLFEDDDGTLYFLWHSGRIARLKPDRHGLAEPYQYLKITVPDPDPNHHSDLCAGLFGESSFDHVGFEGMFLFKANGRYYLTCAEQFEGRYSCMVATSPHLLGPYSARAEAIPHGGHNTFFQDEENQWWSTYFGPPFYEQPSILPVEFTMDGHLQPVPSAPETSGGWQKFSDNPVLGGKYGTCFDLAVLRVSDRYRMWLSWRPAKSVALVESTDGIHWSEPPQIVLGPRKESGWEDDINRPFVLQRADGYHMWYTGQTKPGATDGHSWIGYATSPDGVTWQRQSPKPVVVADQPWEKNRAVMCPSVIWDKHLHMFQMWYSGGEQHEPNAIGYATSPDGLTWKKYSGNPVFGPEPNHPWEQSKVAGAQVVRLGDWYVMFYIGYQNEHSARIGLARSKDGITNWHRHAANPIISPGAGRWDHNACYKPYAVFDGTQWLLWYNGRHGSLEQIGVVFHAGEDLGFEQ